MFIQVNDDDMIKSKSMQYNSIRPKYQPQQNYDSALPKIHEDGHSDL